MTKASPKRVHKKLEQKLAVPANGQQVIDLSKLSDAQRNEMIMSQAATIQVMRDEANLAAQTITQLRADRLRLTQGNQAMAAELQRQTHDKQALAAEPKKRPPPTKPAKGK